MSGCPRLCHPLPHPDTRVRRACRRVPRKCHCRQSAASLGRNPQSPFAIFWTGSCCSILSGPLCPCVGSVVCATRSLSSRGTTWCCPSSGGLVCVAAVPECAAFLLRHVPVWGFRGGWGAAVVSVVRLWLDEGVVGVVWSRPLLFKRRELPVHSQAGGPTLQIVASTFPRIGT